MTEVEDEMGHRPGQEGACGEAEHARLAEPGGTQQDDGQPERERPDVHHEMGVVGADRGNPRVSATGEGVIERPRSERRPYAEDALGDGEGAETGARQTV